MHKSLQRPSPVPHPLICAVPIPKAAAAISVSVNSFKALIRSGKIGYVQTGGKGSRIVIPIKAIEKYLEEHTTKPISTEESEEAGESLEP